MANLFWTKKGASTRNLLSVPFRSEDEFERVVFETRGLLEDVFLLKRQVRGGRKPGIPDVVGVDTDGKVCIVEMKNAPVGAAVLPQVLQYAFWAETNPDSIKTLWLEATELPDDVQLSFEDYEVRIIVIAPDIDRATVNLVDKINYQVDLVEVKRWREAEHEFLLVNRLERAVPRKPKPTRGLETYDRAFYEKHRNKTSVGHFLRFTEETGAFIRKRGWPLDVKFNKTYCGFKHGFFNAFGIKWTGTKSFGFFFKLPEAKARRLSPKQAPLTKYDKQWKEAVYRIEPGQTKLAWFAPLMKAAWEGLTSTS